MSNRYPLMLYGQKGWEDLSDNVTVCDACQEAEARKKGYRRLDEQSLPVAKVEEDPIDVAADEEAGDDQEPAKASSAPAPRKRGGPAKK